MAKLTRRDLLTKTTAGAATIGVVAGAFGGVIGSEVVSNLAQGAAPTAAASQPLMVYVTDARNGDVTFLQGTQEVIRHDPALVARLLKGIA
jgi:hypothetical protein